MEKTIERRQSWCRKALAVLVSVVLCTGLLPIVQSQPQAAYAAETVTTSLTVVYGLDYNGNADVKCNKSYDLPEGSTVEDLLEAAVKAGDIKGYGISSYGYVNSLTFELPSYSGGTYDATVASAEDSATYWSTYKNYVYAQDGAGKYTEVLSDGSSYQFAWASYPTATAPDDLKSIVGSVDPASSEGVNTKLTIVYGGGSQPTVKLNKEYVLASGSTVGDLLKAAADAGDIKGYTFGSNGFIDAISLELPGYPSGTYTKKVSNAADFSTYWSNYKNCEYAKDSEASEKEEVADGSSYQLVWASYPTAVAPTDWTEIKNGVSAGKGYADIAESTAKGSNATDKEAASSLLVNLEKRFVSGGADSAIANNTYNAALALSSLGAGSAISKDDILAALNNHKERTGYDLTAGSLAKYIIALASAGVDCASVVDNGKTRNLIAEMEALPAASDIYSAVVILKAYQIAGKSVPNESAMISAILSSQDLASGLFGGWGYFDTQTTAQAISALLPYKNTDENVANAISLAVSQLLKMQCDDGGFRYMANQTASNIDATAEIAAVLAELGYDVVSGAELTTANGSTPVGYLVGMADSSLNGYTTNSASDEPMTSATVLLALSKCAKTIGGNKHVDLPVANEASTSVSVDTSGLILPEGAVAGVKIASLATDSDAFKALAAKTTTDKYFALEIDLLVNGSAVHENFGKLTVTVDVPSEYNGYYVMVYHLLQSGEIVSDKVAAADGKITFTVDKLSSFLFEKTNEVSATNLGATGDAATTTAGAAGVVALCAIAGLAIARRKVQQD